MALPTGYVTDAADFKRTMVAGLDEALTGVGYTWSTWSIEQGERWTRSWYLLKPIYGSGRPRNHVNAIHFNATHKNPGEKCDLRLDVYADRKRAHGELEWRSFYHLKNDILPALVPGAAVSVLEHPGLRTRAWETRSLAARFAAGEALPQEVRKRIEAYEGRSALGRWWERTGTMIGTTWGRTVGAHAYGALLYFVFPPNWAAFLAFALAVVVGRKMVRSRVWRTVGFVTLAVVLLMPVKVPTLVGEIYMPHGFVQGYDFDPYYYSREPLFALTAALLTAGLAWLVLRQRRRRRGGGKGS